MEEEGTVSLWLGNARSKEDLDRVLEVSFSEDGDFLGSPFSRAFDIEYYEEGLKEAEFFEQPSAHLSGLLQGASYDEAIIAGFGRFGALDQSFNSVVLLYNYRHTGPDRWTDDGIELQFIGATEYR